MEDPAPDPEVAPAPVQDPHRMAFVLLVVLIICGGNGIGIVTAALIWKLTRALGTAIAAVVGITVLALLGAILLYLVHSRSLRRAAPPANAALPPEEAQGKEVK